VTGKRPLNVLAIMPYPLGRAPGQRYRMEQWAPYLEEAGIRVTFQPFASPALAGVLYRQGRYINKAAQMTRAWLAALARVRAAGKFDAVYLYREAALLGPALLERLVYRRNPRLLYDFDDAIWLRYVSPSNRYFSYLKSTPGKTRALCRMAAAVSVGSEHLADFARRYNSNVTVVPSTVSLREYRHVKRHEPVSIPVIGWTGSHSSLQYLRLVEGPLQSLARRRPFRFRVIGVDQLTIPGVPVQCRPWRAATEVEDLLDLDVGIMPLREDPWTLGKCAMKAIQYLAVGVPAVVSPVGANVEVVEHGVAGLHAHGSEDWETSLETCLADVDLRARMGKAGRNVVEEHYCAEVQAPRVAELLRSLVA
jgi:glycosyltransferase involved in cell wall biosynthesis